MPARKKRAQTMQSSVAKASITSVSPGDVVVEFNRCGHCGDLKPQCREQKKCLKDLL